MSKYLVVGLGSMGKRRIRCLLALSIKPEDIWGIDTREDRRTEAHEKYKINVISKERDLDFAEIEAVIVSLPPDKHIVGVNIAAKHKKPVFVEASVVLDDVRQIEANNDQIFIAPSCTLIFHPLLRKIKKIIEAQEYGKICNFSYHSGQFLPDWHPWEKVKDFYVSNRVTGGAREIVPFEMTWITNFFGFPQEIKGYFRKTGNIGCDIEDSYAATLDFGDMVGTLLVDVVSRFATRNLIINFEKGQIQWRWDKKRLEIFNAESGEWSIISEGEQKAEEGYNENIGENMYIDEISAFLKGIQDRKAYPNTILKDRKVLELLKMLENSDEGFDRS